MDGWKLAADFAVGSTGFVLLSYGRRMRRPPHVLLGLVLLGAPWLTGSALASVGVLVVAIGLLWAAVRYGL